jgi:virginiamycin B lyase
MAILDIRRLRICWPVFLLLISGGLSGQTITEYKLSKPVAIPGDIVAGPDGALWFTEDEGGDGIGRITTAGTVTEFRNPSVGNTFYLTNGPDGALWFTQIFSTIGRIDTSGSFTLFPGTDYVNGIATGSDGAIWFTNQRTNSSGHFQLGRLAANGSISFFPLPGPANTDGFSGEPVGIVSGPDGALWFALAGRGMIGRMTTSGSVTDFPIPSGGMPGNIIAGPDGALWFTETGAIGRMTTSGAVTEFPVSVGYWMTVGPDGALWFTENTANKIGRMTLTGVVSEFPIPTPNSGASGITTGPDGALWFTESGAIGRFDLTQAAPVPLLSAWELGALAVALTALGGWIMRLPPLLRCRHAVRDTRRRH